MNNSFSNICILNDDGSVEGPISVMVSGIREVTQVEGEKPKFAVSLQRKDGRLLSEDESSRIITSDVYERIQKDQVSLKDI